jgi:hypothetical protein
MLGKVADVEEIPPKRTVAVEAGVNPTVPQTSQSPAVSEMDVMFEIAPVVKAIVLPEDVTYSPTLRAAAALFVVVPMIPDVELKVMLGVVTVPVNVGFARFAFKLSAVVTKAVVANWVVFVAAAAVGAAGTPVKVGEAKLAFKLSAVVTKAVVANWVVFVAAAAVGAVGTPVRAGEANVARLDRATAESPITFALTNVGKFPATPVEVFETMLSAVRELVGPAMEPFK